MQLPVKPKLHEINNKKARQSLQSCSIVAAAASGTISVSQPYKLQNSLPK
jgi:hypothetical protein